MKVNIKELKKVPERRLSTAGLNPRKRRICIFFERPTNSNTSVDVNPPTTIGLDCPGKYAEFMDSQCSTIAIGFSLLMRLSNKDAAYV